MAEPQKKLLSTQDLLIFSEVHEGIIITKQGELRAILMASSINFALKSEQEQTAIVYAYQSFLNSLSFPIQIMMQSRRLDLSKYLAKLKDLAKVQTNELLRNQTVDYTDFIERLIKVANIMDKKFYVTIPFMPPVQNNNKPMGGLFGPKNQTPKITPQQLASYTQEIKQRVEVVTSGLGSIGVRAAQLNTQQVIELLYGLYNPEEAAKEKLIDFNHLDADVVESELEK